MSLPPGFLDELRSRVSLAHVVGRKVIWDTRKSNQGKGDMWAPCPFHQEKTASFHVDDRKGYYYCFGCHATVPPSDEARSALPAWMSSPRVVMVGAHGSGTAP